MNRETIIGLSGVYEAERFWESEKDCNPVYLNFEDLDETTFFCGKDAAAKLRAAVRELAGDCIHWIDSGDYHYLSLFFLERVKEPFCLLLLDHHSDMKESAFAPGLLSCGSWVKRSLETLPLLKRVIMIGPDDDEIMEQEAEYREKTVRITEEELAKAASQEAQEPKEALGRMLSEWPVYISFDKDVLAPSSCETGWSQGGMTPDTALELIGLAYQKTKVIGIDICGEAPKEEGAFLAEAVHKNAQMNRFLRHRIISLIKEHGCG